MNLVNYQRTGYEMRMHEKCKAVLNVFLVKFYIFTFMYNVCDYE
jgi:hypothetical protein